MLINHYTDHKQHTTQPPTPKTWCQQSWAMRPTGVEREPDSMLASCITFMPNPKNAPTPTTQTGSVLMQAQETHTQPNQPGAHPPKMGSLERR